MKAKKEIKFAVIICLVLAILNDKIICPFRKYLSIPCPSCGLTRALKYFLCLHFKESFYFHPMLIFILPALFLGLAREKFSTYKKKYIDAYIIVTSVLFFIVYIIRLMANSIP